MQIEMHIKQKKIKPWSPYWIALETLNMICQLVSLVACIGAVEGIYQDWCEATACCQRCSRCAHLLDSSLGNFRQPAALPLLTSFTCFCLVPEASCVDG